MPNGAGGQAQAMKAAGADLGKTIGGIAQAYADIQSTDIRERQTTTRKRYQRDVDFKDIERKLFEKYLSVGQTSIQETRKSISDLTKPFYEVSWHKRGKFNKLNLSYLTMLMFGACGEVFYHYRMWQEHQSKEDYWRAQGNETKAATYDAWGDIQRQAYFKQLNENFAGPWKHVVTTGLEHLQDTATEIVYPPPPDPLIHLTNESEPDPKHLFEAASQAGGYDKWIQSVLERLNEGL